MRRLARVACSLLMLAGFSQTVQATTVTFFGQDNGSTVGGPIPNSVAARNAFLIAAGAFGPLDTFSFENAALGFHNVNLHGGAGTIVLAAPNLGPGISGISNTTFGNIYGYNINPNGTNWLGFPSGSAIFNFTSPTHSFGTFFTGLQTFFGTELTISLNDASNTVLQVPVSTSGGAEYFGFTNTESFTQLTITRPANQNGNDYYGLDAFTINIAPVPEPATWAMMFLGFAGVGFVAYRRSRRESASA